MSDDVTQQHGGAPARRRSALDWVASTVGNEALLQELQLRARRRRRRRTALAGGVVAVLIAGFVAMRPFPHDVPVAAGPVSPLQVLLPRQQVLPDGSLVELRDDARIEVDFSGPQRRITLVRGEAHFSVQKDPARPFVVHAEGVAVRAVGTAFAVQMASRGVEVLVTEGRVAVDHAAATLVSAEAAPLALVTAGQATVIQPRATGETPPPSPQVTAIDEAALTERLAWRVPRLELSGTPLEVAVEAFNRHSTVKLVIGDRSLAGLKVSGIVRADQADALVSLLAANFDVIAEPQSTGAVRLRRAR